METDKIQSAKVFELRAPPGYVIFCEDVRDEASGQSTYVGVYDKSLVAGSFPARLPSFTIIVCLYILSSDPKESFSVQFAFPGDEKAISTNVDINDLELGEESEPGINHITSLHIFRGMRIKEPGYITVVGNLDGESYIFGRLRVEAENLDN